MIPYLEDVSMNKLLKINPKPFLKWAGGKSQLIETITFKLPINFKEIITKYCEPFIGGGAVFFNFVSNYDFEKVYISDVNYELINTYIVIRDNVLELLEKLESYQREYISLSISDRKDYYYRKRGIFNIEKKNKSDKIELAALFIFLNKTCFNGLYRVNKDGEFNVPAGNYKNPKIYDKLNLIQVSISLKTVDIVNATYYECIDFTDEKTLVYIDPPYRPLTKTSSFTSYSNITFGDENQKELALFIDNLTDMGVKVIASNSDPKNIDKNDNFFDEIYEKHNIYRVEAKRMINSKSDKRGIITELLITNY
ncbi:MAG: Dam family site-specific DNA-(adenine-N6)-methyltransferase [Tissierellia bacterium]|nr:Dam family site-specific DNA-(adenine-N6)-methyltransferase [Tissierellia bacterium]